MISSMSERTNNLLELRNIYAGYSGSIRKMNYVLQDLSLSIKNNECVGLIGESGSGKTTLANIITGFLQPISGQILFQDNSIEKLALKKRAKQLSYNIQMVFQDPYSSFNPRKTIGYQLMEPLVIQKRFAEEEIEAKAYESLEQVGLAPDYFLRYPHQLSGGQLQRAALGCSLIMTPRLLIADEPVSSLDVSVQAQVLDLIQDLREKLEFSCLFISHDLAVIYHLCDTVAVLDQGSIVEYGPVEKVFENPQNDYTKQLIFSMGY
jgi:peptide/nickel transport system ATP-binding protein